MRLLCGVVDREGIAVTVLPSPDRHILSIDVEHPSRKGVSFRLAIGDRALCARWRTYTGTGVNWVGRDRVRRLWPRGA